MERGKNFGGIAALLAARFVILGSAYAQVNEPPKESPTSQQSEADLAKATQNPVSDLITVPLQSNFNFGVGPGDDMGYLLNVQPVVPFRVGENWNVITRTILPIIYQPTLAPGVGDVFGLGDLNPTFFLSPAKSGKLIWGIGPTLTFPTATDDALGSGKWSAGPAAVLLTMQGPWVFGALANNQWSFAGDGGRADVNALLIQPFVNYNLPDGWYITSVPIITANFEGDNAWTIPVGGGGGKIVKAGKLPLNLQLQAFWNAKKPAVAGADWSMRFNVQFLFPKG
jgi:hypothetical protein